VLVLYLFSMISLASVVSAIVGVLSVLTFPAIHFLLPNYDYFLTFIVILLAFIIIIRHKDNISRIKHHTENLIPWGLNLSKQVPKK
ncbi:TPA: glycerol-3-phosphate acyltransferase, partial [Streptococcus pyogenes]|nr:glycerol-3-phosphate acyltransferase [Streptococcus pyogenes]